MKIVSKEEHIPAKTVTYKRYIASDGKEFAFELDCINYERQLEINNHPVFKSKISNVYTFEEDLYAVLYYISSQDDYDFLVDNLTLYGLHTDYPTYGPGWYIYYVIDGGDYPSSYFLYNYEVYEKDIENRWNEWKEDMREKMKGSYHE